MSDQRSNEILSIILGTIAATGLGSLLFQALGVFLLGLLGATAGWVFNAFIKPWLDKTFVKKNQKKA